MMEEDNPDDNLTEYLSDEATPPSIIIAADDASKSLLPSTSRVRYERTYSDFMKWRSENTANSFSERILLAYFSGLSDKSKPTTLWAYYSMLKSTLSLNHGIDISKYSKLISFLKRQAEGYRPKKAQVFTEAEMKQFIFGARDEEWLVVKVS